MGKRVNGDPGPSKKKHRPSLQGGAQDGAEAMVTYGLPPCCPPNSYSDSSNDSVSPRPRQKHVVMAIASIHFHQICLLYPISRVLKYRLHSSKEVILTLFFRKLLPYCLTDSNFPKRIPLFPVFLKSKHCLSHHQEIYEQ